MPEDTCSIPDCARPRLNRMWCRAHYLRWYKHGDPLGGRSPVRATKLPTCSIAGCDRTNASQGLCSAHYQRLMRLGSPGSVDVELRRKDGVCSMPDCDRKYYGQGYCTKHYQRWAKFGDPETVLPGPWMGDDVGYSAVHERLVRTKGSARTHICLHCDGPAEDWAYDGTCPDEKVGERHGYPLTYSTDPDRYMPLCRACHSRFDRNYPQTSRQL